ncbi:abortive infection system antitoxin AbiGi family protein [Roseateles microcysteis]|uniref:abortive infection system antitoxin AbiGi family protein n=1 Tax=Roseateles microcysteis TaxID=3119057 RepID=UPI002FE532B0
MTAQRYYSNIYWHFTGSPKGIDWREVRRPADIKDQGPVLDPATAKDTLKLILTSKTLLGRCTERVVADLETAKFCCVTDIPLKDLPSHAPYYGKVAIGFKASAVHKSFLPVMYVPTESMPVVEMMVPNRKLTEMANDFLKYQSSFQEQQAMKLMSLAMHNKEVVRKPDAEAMKGFLMNFVKVTDFDPAPENTFYREREWRNIGDFGFTVDDVAAVVVPEALIGEVREHFDQERYPPSISIVAWEFIEHA